MTPELLTFGDEDHQIGEASVIITGLHFGVFPGNLGAVWVSDNADIGAAGNTDKITTFNSWGGQYIDFDMPGSMNNTPGARFAFVVSDTGDWSFVFPFTLSAAAVGGGSSPLGQGGGAVESQYRPNVFDMRSASRYRPRMRSQQR